MSKELEPMKPDIYKRMMLHIYHSIVLIKKIKTLPEPNKYVNFRFKKKASSKKLIVFDLDHTLIHCDSEEEDIELLVEEELGLDICKEGYQPLIITDPEDGSSQKIRFAIRPYAVELLQLASLFYEVAIFTAGAKNYADPILDILDPEGTLI